MTMAELFVLYIVKKLQTASQATGPHFAPVPTRPPRLIHTSWKPTVERTGGNLLLKPRGLEPLLLRLHRSCAHAMEAVAMADS